MSKQRLATLIQPPSSLAAKKIISSSHFSAVFKSFLDFLWPRMTKLFKDYLQKQRILVSLPLKKNLGCDSHNLANASIQRADCLPPLQKHRVWIWNQRISDHAKNHIHPTHPNKAAILKNIKVFPFRRHVPPVAPKPHHQD